MKKMIFALTALCAASVVMAGAIDDTTYFFRTAGVDRYQDGTQVLAGERYALVWSAGEFAGFNADGSLVNAEDEVLGVFAVATAEGNCPLCAYGVPSRIVLKGGNISLWLLDTRVFAADGKVTFSAAKGETAVASIAGAAKVAADITVAGDQPKYAAGGASTAAATALPADVPQPVVKDLRIDDKAGLVYLTVDNTAGYVTYDVAAGDNVGALEGGKAATPVTGGGEIILITPKTGDNQFFKVIRK